MTDLPQRVEQNIQNRDLFKRGATILVAVSGGLDSMTLLHVLNELSARNRWQLVIAHYNHRLRGRASDADERLVCKTAAAMKLRMIRGGAYVKTFAAKSKLSLEMAARKLRHEFLSQAAKEHKIKTIAIAHHAGDQVELFFLRLLRGSGGEGVAGMKWCSRSPADKTITLVRPLMDISKIELMEFARESKIHFRADATNFSPDFLRNRIRNELLPLLRKKYQPGLDKAVLRLMEIVGTESEFIGETARRWLKTGRTDLPVNTNAQQRVPTKTDFERLPVATQRRVVQWQLGELGITSGFDLIESLRQSTDCFVSVEQKISVARDIAGKVFLRADPISKFNKSECAVKLGSTGEAIFGGRHFHWLVQAQKHTGGTPVPLKQREFFDADKIVDPIVLRHWRAGDRFQPIGLKSAAKLQDLFVNAKIPATRRRELVLATTTDCEIFWVEGLRIGERFKLTPQTKRKLVWKWSNLAV